MIIHLAAVVPVNLVNKNKIKAKKVNFIGTKILIKKIKKYYSKKIWFLCFNFTCTKRTHLKINRKSEIRPINYYALTKHKSEKYLIKNSNVVNYCIGRIFSFTSKNKAMNLLYQNLFRNLKIMITKFF